jgi:signal transduction histidine kinase
MSTLAIEQAHVQNDATVEVRLALTAALGTIAHELRQPLSSIESIAYYLTLVLPKNDPKIQAQVEHIRELVQQTNEILSNSVRLTGGAQHSSPTSLPVCPQAVDPVEGR